MATWIKITLVVNPVRLKQISYDPHPGVPGAPRWGVTDSDQIYRIDGVTFKRIAGSLKHVSIGRPYELNNAPVWGVNSSNAIWRWHGGSSTGNDWERIPGSLKQVSVGTAGVWGVNGANKIFRWNGNATSGPGSFDLIGGALLKMVASGKDGVWGINAQNKIYRWRGTGNTWDLIGGMLVQIDVGNVACGVNAQGQVWRWRGGGGTGNTWERLGTKSDFKYVNITEEGGIEALDTVGDWWAWAT